MSTRPDAIGPADTTVAPPELSAKRVIGSTLVALAVVMAVVFAVGVWFREPLVLLSRAFVDVAGGPGIALGFFVPDAFTVPIPNDAFSTFGIAGGLPFWDVVWWGSAGSIAGGCTGWLIGRSLRRWGRLDRFLTGRGAVVESLVRRHGAWMVAAAAVSPLPYSVSAWAAGAVHLPLRVFVAVSSLRVVRVAGFLYLIELGLLTTAT
jgi:membrane protein YqaA with SNARE-associated domain